MDFLRACVDALFGWRSCWIISWDPINRSTCVLQHFIFSLLDTLGEACGRCGWIVHAFVLMGNHYHLLLETPEANLVDDISGRAKYRHYMQKRVLEVLRAADPGKIDADWDRIRRGWVFGSDEFRQEMEAAIDGAMSGKRRDSFAGDMANKHDEQEAEHLLDSGLGVCGLSREDLAGLKKGDNQKKAIAWLIRRNTSVRNEWISEALNMGHPSSVSRNVRIVENAGSGVLLKLKEKMLKFKD